MASSRRKIRVVLQRDSMQCGVACLCMIGRYWGIKRSLSGLGEVCHATSEGVSMKGIMDAAQKIGLDCKAGRVSVSQISMCPLPAILHWNQNHFVVLYKVSKGGNRFHIADPGKGMIKYSKEEFLAHWVADPSADQVGIAMFFEPNALSKTYHEDSCDNSEVTPRSFSFLARYIRNYKQSFWTIGITLLIGSLLQLILPFLTQSIVDVGIKHKNLNFIWLILLGELMIVCGKTVTDFIRRRLLLHVSIRINISLISDFFIKLLKLPMSFFDTKLMGDLLQRMGDHSRVQNFLTGQVLGLIFTFLSFLIFGIVLAIYNSLVFVIFSVGSIIYALWIASFLSRRKVLDYELFEVQARNENKTYQFITSMQEIKLQDCERRRRQEWEDVQGDLFKIQMKALKLRQSQEAGSIFINEIKNIIITVLSATAVISGEMTLGAMLAVQYIIGQLNSPVEQIMSFIYSLQDVKISLERINEIHECKNEENDGNRLTRFPGDKDIVIDSVNFKYDPHATKQTLEQISFNIPQGKVTAIVGASGSGKTTLVKLMLGYYPVESGKISISGSPIGNYDLKWWRRHCGVVMQDGVIFSESIARNIAVDDGEIDEDRLIKAAKIANIHDYVMSLPLKYNTLIGRDGVGLSQGQKQRILIARAVYKNPDFIFLDEATNSLDARNERQIVERLEEFYKGRTAVVVAHRLSTVKNADQIIVLDEGKVVETGDHSSLIEKKGAYYNLVKNQLELGI